MSAGLQVVCGRREGRGMKRGEIAERAAGARGARHQALSVRATWVHRCRNTQLQTVAAIDGFNAKHEHVDLGAIDEGDSPGQRATHEYPLVVVLLSL